jgi:Fe-S-cluster containining protein
MPALRVDPEQRFTCSQCGRCCRRPWEIVVTPAEAESYRKRQAQAWYRELAEGAEGTERDPFEPIPGTRGFHRIRKRDDGACGFLSPQNRCRLHEELGGARKPLTCRMFPYHFHPVDDSIVVTTSFCCPTTIANQGATPSEQRNAIDSLRAEWFAVYPEPPKPTDYVAGRAIDAAALRTLREVLRTMLDRTDAEGKRRLRGNVLRMAATLEDLSRHRVVRLKDQAFAEYLGLTGRHAATTEKPVPARGPSLVGRLMQRGFLFVVAATRLQVENKSFSGLRLGLRLRLFRLLAHFHGLGPGVSGIDLGAARAVPVDVDSPELQPIVYHYLRASIESLGTGQRPVLEEFAIAVSYLNAARALASMRAKQAGVRVDPSAFSEALMEAVDLTHADDRGLLGKILGTFAAGTESLYAFAAYFAGAAVAADK